MTSDCAIDITQIVTAVRSVCAGLSAIVVPLAESDRDSGFRLDAGPTKERHPRFLNELGRF